jgi:cysteine desulfurase
VNDAPIVYLDHAASTPMRPEAVAAMRPYLDAQFANPSGGHRASRESKYALEDARERVAEQFACAPADVIFTGGGSEADNLAVKGAAWAGIDHGLDRVVVSGIEHKAVLAAAQRLARDGIATRTVGATVAGTVDLDALADSLDERTAVVSVMTVNNETGIVQPLGAIAALVRERAPRAVFHTDAVQAPQWLDLRAATAPADLVAISGHKFGGPKGVGVLVRRGGVPLVPLVDGGGHEFGLRGGTHNVAGILALAAALDATDAQRIDECTRIAALRDRLEHGLGCAIDDTVVNGDPNHRVAGLLHLAFAGVEAEALLVALDLGGVCAAAGSACSSGAIEPSHVLVAMGLPRERAVASVRFSLGWASTDADIDAALALVPPAVERLRAGGMR